MKIRKLIVVLLIKLEFYKHRERDYEGLDYAFHLQNLKVYRATNKLGEQVLQIVSVTIK